MTTDEFLGYAFRLLQEPGDDTEYSLILDAMRSRPDVVALFADAIERAAVKRRADGSWNMGDTTALERIYRLAEMQGIDAFSALDVICFVTQGSGRARLRLVPQDGP